MKKRIILCVTCIAVITVYADAQNKTTYITDSYAIAPPPEPPVPPTPPLPPMPPAEAIELVLPAPPPLPPIPPMPPVPSAEDFIYDCPGNIIEIINNNGNEISVHQIKGKSMVVVKTDGKTQTIKLSTWMANKKYYDKKYGQLPPPPPAISKDAVFVAPLTIEDVQ